MNNLKKRVIVLSLKLILALLIFPVTIFIGFIIDTEILGHVEGFAGVYHSIPIAIVLTLCSICYILYNHFKNKRLKADEIT